MSPPRCGRGSASTTCAPARAADKAAATPDGVAPSTNTSQLCSCANISARAIKALGARGTSGRATARRFHSQTPAPAIKTAAPTSAARRKKACKRRWVRSREAAKREDSSTGGEDEERRDGIEHLGARGRSRAIRPKNLTNSEHSGRVHLSQKQSSSVGATFLLRRFSFTEVNV